jgi:hypothetical protein
MGPRWGQRARRADPTRPIAIRMPGPTSANKRVAPASPPEKRMVACPLAVVAIRHHLGFRSGLRVNCASGEKARGPGAERHEFDDPVADGAGGVAGVDDGGTGLNSLVIGCTASYLLEGVRMADLNTALPPALRRALDLLADPPTNPDVGKGYLDLLGTRPVEDAALPKNTRA